VAGCHLFRRAASRRAIARNLSGRFGTRCSIFMSTAPRKDSCAYPSRSQQLSAEQPTATEIRTAQPSADPAMKTLSQCSAAFAPEVLLNGKERSL